MVVESVSELDEITFECRVRLSKSEAVSLVACRSVLLIRLIVEEHCIGIGARTRRFRRSVYHAQLLHRFFPLRVRQEVGV